MLLLWHKSRVCSCFCFRSGFFCFFKQKTAYEVRISDWSSNVCSSDLADGIRRRHRRDRRVDATARGPAASTGQGRHGRSRPGALRGEDGDRMRVVEGKRVSARVDIGGRRIITIKTHCIILAYVLYSVSIYHTFLSTTTHIDSPI